MYWIASLFDRAADWLFAPAPAIVAGILRIGIGIMTLFWLMLYAGNLQAFFGPEGMLSVKWVQSFEPARFSLFFFYDSMWFVYLLFAVLVVVAMCFTLGIWSRYACVVLYILFISFVSRFNFVRSGGEDVLTIGIFCCLFLETDRALTFRWFQRFVPTKETVQGWPLRFMQYNLLVILFFTVMAKLQESQWFAGTIMADILVWQVATFNFTWLTRFPVIPTFLNYFTIVVELLAPFTMWSLRTHRATLIALTLLMLGISSMMNVTHFTNAMLVCLPCFINQDDLDGLSRLGLWIKTNLRSLLPASANNA